MADQNKSPGVRRVVFDLLDAAVNRRGPFAERALNAAEPPSLIAGILAATNSTVFRAPRTEVEDAVRLWREGMEVARG